MSKKYRTIEQVATAQDRAVRFAQNVLQDDEKADELASLSPEEYAERKRIQIITPNPTERNRPTTMPKPTRADLEARVQELEEENSDLNERLDAIADLVGTSEEADEDSDESDDDEEEDDEEED
jgi:hypothetical protein